MEPVEVDTFQGRWSQSPPRADAIRIANAPEARFGEIIELTLARLTHLSRPEAAWLFEQRDTFEGLSIHEALDRHDRLLGWGMAGRPSFAPPERQFLRVVVAGEHEGRGVGRALYASLRPRLLSTTRRINSGVFDDDPRSHAIALHWGFELEEHAIDSSLDLTLLPVPDLPPGVTLAEAPDVRFEDEAEVDAMLLASQTNPEAAVGWVFDLAKLRTLVAPSETPICVVARVDGQPAGITFGAVTGGELGIAYSGVDPQFRGRGLMRLIKQQAHLAARRAGALVSRTNNEEHNAGIRRINADLGYVVTSGVYRMVRAAEGPDE